MAMGCVNCMSRMPAFVTTCTRCGGRLVPYDDSDEQKAIEPPGPLLRLYRRIFGTRRNRLIAMSSALAISVGLIAFTLDKKPELNPVAAEEEPAPVSVAQPAIVTVSGLDVPLPTRAISPTARPTTRPAPTPAPRVEQPQSASAAPVPQPVALAETTFAVNTLQINCHSEPLTTTGVVSRKSANAVSQVTMVVTMQDGVWHYDGAKKCWIKTNPAPVRLFPSKSAAEAFIRSNKPAPTQDPKVKAYIDKLDELTAQYTAAAERARTIVSQPSITDTGWRLRYRDAWLAVVPSSAEVKALKPQNCHKASLATVQSAVATLGLASEQAMRGLESVDAALLEQAMTLLDEGIGGLTAANEAAKNAFCS